MAEGDIEFPHKLAFERTREPLGIVAVDTGEQVRVVDIGVEKPEQPSVE